jgi:hypothetical protein
MVPRVPCRAAHSTQWWPSVCSCQRFGGYMSKRTLSHFEHMQERFVSDAVQVQGNRRRCDMGKLRTAASRCGASLSAARGSEPACSLCGQAVTFVVRVDTKTSSNQLLDDFHGPRLCTNAALDVQAFGTAYKSGVSTALIPQPLMNALNELRTLYVDTHTPGEAEAQPTSEDVGHKADAASGAGRRVGSLLPRRGRIRKGCTQAATPCHLQFNVHVTWTSGATPEVFVVLSD